MWRLLSVALMGAALWAVSQVLPASNDEEQLRSLIGILAGGDSSAASLDMSAPPAPVEVHSPIPQPGPSDDAAKSTALAASDATVTMSRPVMDAVQRTQLVVKLQQQLRRVGCLRTTVDGSWNAATRRAMARFNQRISAQLPLDDPDFTLLTLLEKFDNRACGDPCPIGALPDADGVCRQRQIVADAVPVPIEATSPAPVTALMPASAFSKAGGSTTARKPAPVLAQAPSVLVQQSAQVATAAQVVASQQSITGGWTAAVVPAPVPVAKTAPQVVAALQSPSDPTALPGTADGGTTIAVVPRPTQAKKRVARKSSGWGSSQVGLGAAPSRPKAIVNLVPGSAIVVSRRFVGGGSVFAGSANIRLNGAIVVGRR